MDARNDDSSGGSDSLDKSLQRKCVMDDVGQSEGAQQQTDGIECTELTYKSQRNKTDRAAGDGGGGGGGGVGTTDTNTAIIEPASNINTPPANNNSSFETKVKQISKDLKETTLAEHNATCCNSASSSSCSSSTSLAAGSADNYDQNSQLSLTESADDNRSKKVRFHPDVKENDGGNRVIPKKKKKLKSNSNSGDDANNAGSAMRTDDDMDYEDEEEIVEEEEEFNLAKTIAEAQNYLKLHPLTFVRASTDKNNPMPNAETPAKRLQNGLLLEDDLPLLSESSEEEDLYEEMQPESGIERILGKQIKNGKAELLVRLVNVDGLFWQSEEHIAMVCPNMINKYEINREKRQERLMRHVAKRQNLRQRYTDF